MRYQILSLYCLFFFSGATSLVYESLWIRMLSFGVGSTSAAMSMVLSIFFFGLSLGSYMGGKYAQRVKDPIFAYGLMEGLSGIFALIILFPILKFQEILSLLPFEDSFSLGFTIIKFVFVFVLLILPTLCMGATLPLLIQICSQQKGQHGRSISFLYALNTFGAVFGAFMTSFALIPSMGILKAYIFTVVISVIVLIASKILGKSQTIYNFHKPIDQSTVALIESKKIKAWSLLIISGCVGFAAIAAQVVWNKYLGIYFGTNIFGLGIILSIFLFGIALGSYVLSLYIDGVENKLRLLLVFLILGSISLLLTSQIFSILPIVTNTIIYYIGESISLVLLKSILSGIALLPSTFIFGSILPLIIRILSHTKEEAAKATGMAYSINTLGSILGAYLTGLYFVPILGSSNSLRIGIFLFIASTLFLGFQTLHHKKVKILLSLTCIGFSLFCFRIDAINFKNIIKSAYLQTSEANISLKELLRYFAKDYEEFQFVHEGRTAIISLSHDQQDGEDYKKIYRLKTNGLNESLYNVNSLDVIPKYEGLLGFLPYMLSRNPQSAFVIGYGGGYTVDFLTQTDLKEVFVSELEEGIIKASNFVYKKEKDGKNPILDRPNLVLKIEDARYALAQQKQLFDIIVSQPSHSWLTGVANLFTDEYFRIVNNKLSQKGVFAQWLNLYNISPDVVKSILKTFYEVFPEGYVFTNVDDDEMIIIGSNSPLKIHYSKLKSLVSNRHFQRILAYAQLTNAEDFLTNYAFDRETALEFSKGAPINSDLNAYAEVEQSRLFYGNRQISEVKQFLAKNFTPNIFDHLNQSKLSPDSFYKPYLDNLLSHQKYAKFFKTIEFLQKDQNMSHIVGEFCYKSERFACAKKYLALALESQPTPEILNLYLATLIETKALEEYKLAKKKFAQLRNEQSPCYIFEGDLEFKILSQKPNDNSIKNNLKNCGEYFRRSLARYYMRTKNFDLAQKMGYEYLSANDNDLAINKQMLSISILYSDKNSTQFYLNHLNQLLYDEKVRLESLRSFFDSKGWNDESQFIQEKLNTL